MNKTVLLIPFFLFPTACAKQDPTASSLALKAKGASENAAVATINARCDGTDSEACNMAGMQQLEVAHMVSMVHNSFLDPDKTQGSLSEDQYMAALVLSDVNDQRLNTLQQLKKLNPDHLFLPRVTGGFNERVTEAENGTQAAVVLANSGDCLGALIKVSEALTSTKVYDGFSSNKGDPVITSNQLTSLRTIGADHAAIVRTCLNPTSPKFPALMGQLKEQLAAKQTPVPLPQ